MYPPFERKILARNLLRHQAACYLLQPQDASDLNVRKRVFTMESDNDVTLNKVQVEFEGFTHLFNDILGKSIKNAKAM